MACLSFSNTDSSTSRVRAFSVGSKTKIPRSDIQRDILNYRSSIKRYSNCCYNKSDLNEVTTNYQLINFSSYNDKKSTSAPVLNQKSQNSFDRMSDLMEIDFSKSQKEITASLARPYHSCIKTSYTQKVLKSNNTPKIQNMNCLSASQVSENNGYLEMKPVSSNLDLNAIETKDDLRVYQFKLPENQNDSIRLFCEIKDEHIFKTLQSSKDMSKFENKKKSDVINNGLMSNAIEYKNQILESLANDQNDLKLKNVDKNRQNCNEVVKEYSIKNTKTETLNNFQFSCFKDHSFNEQRSEIVFDAKNIDACNEDVYNMLSKHSEMSRNLSRIFFKYKMYGNESGYDKLHMKSESSLQPKIIYQLPRSGKLDLRSSQIDVIGKNSMKKGYLPFFKSSHKSSIASTAISCDRNKNSSLIYRPLSIENSLDCFELKSVNNIMPEQRTSSILKPQSESSDIELCYASLDLPQYQFETNYTVCSAKTSLPSTENVFDSTLRTGSPSNFPYAKINFHHGDSNV